MRTVPEGDETPMISAREGLERLREGNRRFDLTFGAATFGHP